MVVLVLNRVFVGGNVCINRIGVCIYIMANE